MSQPSDATFLGHPRGLATLFFTEMWERFSYYGMRALLILFMTASIAKGGLGFGADKAGPIYAMYTALVYLATVPGGWLADNFLGQRKSVLYGGIIIMTGHILLAMHGLAMFYAGLAFIVVGTGLLKPNISVIVGQLYSAEDKRRDSGFSIFYMGINLGAFTSPLVCGYLAQKDHFKGILESWGMDPVNSWHWGFAAAAVGMFFGVVQYIVTGHHLGDAGLRPTKAATPEIAAARRRTLGIGIGATVVSLVALVLIDRQATYLEAVSWQSSGEELRIEGVVSEGAEVLRLHEGGPIAVGALDRHLGEDTAKALRRAVLREEVASGNARGEKLEVFQPLTVDELPVVVKAEAEATPPASDEKDPIKMRLKDFRWSSTDGALTVEARTVEAPEEWTTLGVFPPEQVEEALDGPLAAIGQDLIEGVVSDAVAGNRAQGNLTAQSVKVGGLNAYNINSGFMVLLFLTVVLFFAKLFLAGQWTKSERARLVTIFVLFCGAAVFWGLFEQAGSTLTLFADRATNNAFLGREFPSSWWQSANALMIIVLAPFFAWLWLRLGKRNPSYPAKFAVGITFAALGFGVLVGGASLAKGGVLVSPMWLFAVYLLHTIGELCLSPVGLSSMTKLAPARIVSLMMGVWFLGASVGNYIGGSVSGFYEDFELPTLFGAVAISGGVMALVMFILVGPMRRMMERSGAEEATS